MKLHWIIPASLILVISACQGKCDITTPFSDNSEDKKICDECYERCKSSNNPMVCSSSCTASEECQRAYK